MLIMSAQPSNDSYDIGANLGKKNFWDSSYLLITKNNHTHLITSYLIKRMLCELWCTGI